MRRLLLALFALIVLTQASWAKTVATSFDPSILDSSNQGYVVGDVWINTATLNEFKAISVTPGAVVWRHVPRVMCASAVAVAAPLDTSEDVLATCSIAANAMGLNGALRIAPRYSYTNSGNNKTLRVRFSGAAGTVVFGPTRTTQLGEDASIFVANRGATNSQVAGGLAGNDASTADGFAGSTPAADTTAATSVVLSCQKATGAEACTLERYTVELIRPDIQ